MTENSSRVDRATTWFLLQAACLSSLLGTGVSLLAGSIAWGLITAIAFLAAMGGLALPTRQALRQLVKLPMGQTAPYIRLSLAIFFLPLAFYYSAVVVAAVSIVGLHRPAKVAVASLIITTAVVRVLYLRAVRRASRPEDTGAAILWPWKAPIKWPWSKEIGKRPDST